MNTISKDPKGSQNPLNGKSGACIGKRGSGIRRRGLENVVALNDSPLSTPQGRGSRFGDSLPRAAMEIGSCKRSRTTAWPFYARYAVYFDEKPCFDISLKSLDLVADVYRVARNFRVAHKRRSVYSSRVSVQAGRRARSVQLQKRPYPMRRLQGCMISQGTYTRLNIARIL